MGVALRSERGKPGTRTAEIGYTRVAEMLSMRKLVGPTLGLLMIVPGVAAAQGAQSFSDLPKHLSAGQSIVVLDQSGRRTKGRLVELTADEIVIDRRQDPDDRGRTRLGRQDVRQISRPRDPLWNGVVIGIGVGLGSGCLVGWNTYDPDKAFSFGPGESCAIAAVVFGGVGAGVGAIADYFNRKDGTVYRAQPGQVTFLPAVGRGLVALQARWLW
jgi:hypothetical protein